MNVRSKWLCQTKTQIAMKSSYGDVAYRVTFIPVWEGTAVDGRSHTEENRMFGDATPSGSIEMTICNPNAADAYRAGQCYYFDSEHAGLPTANYYGHAHDPATGKYRDPDTGELKTFSEVDAERRKNDQYSWKE